LLLGLLAGDFFSLRPDCRQASSAQKKTQIITDLARGPKLIFIQINNFPCVAAPLREGLFQKAKPTLFREAYFKCISFFRDETSKFCHTYGMEMCSEDIFSTQLKSLRDYNYF
jgi:hypothetical protein